VKLFTDIELSAVDAGLKGVGEEWRNFPPQQVGRAIGCDALLYGEVTEADRLYLALYSQLTVAASVRLVEVATGRTLAQQSYATKFREAGVPFSPLSAVSDAVKTWMNLSETQMTRAIDDLGRNLAERIPNLPETPTVASEQSVAPSAVSLPPSTDVTPPGRDTATPAGPDKQRVPAVAVATLSVPAPVSLPTEILPAAPPTRPRTRMQYRLQIAAFRTYSDAQQVVRLLRDKGYPAMIAQTGEAGRIWNRVVLGPFPSEEEVRRARAEIKKLAPLSPVVITRTGR
jgi:cell division septation protein DedD